MSVGARPRSRTSLAAGLALTAGCAWLLIIVLSAADADLWWSDYAGGPATSRYFPSKQITRANVDKLQIAWTYPYGETGFNPIVARGTVYGRGRNGAIVALDARTGKEIWIHDNMQGMTARGMNYWESADGKDRRDRSSHQGAPARARRPDAAAAGHELIPKASPRRRNT